MCLLQLPCTVEYLYRYLHMFLYQYRTQKTRYRGKAKSSAAVTREKTFSSTNNSFNGNDVYICISTMERLFPTNEICRNISFPRAKRSCSLFTDYYTSWGSADRIYVCWSIYMMTDVGWWCWRPYLYNYRVNIDILYIKMNVYSSAIDVLTLFAPLEALKASADRIILHWWREWTILMTNIGPNVLYLPIKALDDTRYIFPKQVTWQSQYRHYTYITT